jgi:SPP1 gp7 family putative phage head morphogenesis protein
MSLLSDEKKREAYFTRAEREYEKQVAKVFRDALDEIRVEMSKIYEKYAVNGILTNAQMTQYNRLATLQKNIAATMSPAARKATKIIEALKPNEYGASFFRTAWAIDNNTTIALSFGALDKKAIIATLDNPFFDSATKTLEFNAVNRISGAISNGLAIGQSYAEMMKDMKDMVNRDNADVMRVLRTELHDAVEAGSQAGYQDAIDQGVKGRVRWIATLDDRVRDTHAEMDGVYQDDDGMFRGAIEAEYPGWPGLPPEERINCRCTTFFELEGMEEPDGNSTQTYESWIKDKSIF